MTFIFAMAYDNWKEQNKTIKEKRQFLNKIIFYYNSKTKECKHLKLSSIIFTIIVYTYTV